MKPSDEDLVDQMWDALPLAWVGGSIGTIMIIGSIFWRFVVRPPRLVIDYGDGDKVWSINDSLLHITVPPPVPMSETLVMVALVFAGIAIAWASSAKWREARNELNRRRSR